jgi:hypothetical protein
MIMKQSGKATRDLLRKYRNNFQSLDKSENDYDFYLPVVISCATGSREGLDEKGAGPDVVYTTKLMQLFYKERFCSYSNLLSSDNEDDYDFCLRLDSEAHKCRVFIALLSQAYLNLEVAWKSSIRPLKRRINVCVQYYRLFWRMTYTPRRRTAG